MRITTKKLIISVTTIFMLFLLGSATAEISRGEVLGAACAQCHGTNGNAVSSWPSLRGKSASTMYKTLLERKYRSPEGIMDLQARGYTNEQLFLISQFYGSLASSEEGDD